MSCRWCGRAGEGNRTGRAERVVGVALCSQMLGSGRSRSERNGAGLIHDAGIGSDDGPPIRRPGHSLVIYARDNRSDRLIAAPRCRNGGGVNVDFLRYGG